MLRRAFEEHDEKGVRSLNGKWWEKVVVAVFEETQLRARGSLNTSFSDLMELAAIKAFFARGAKNLLDDKMSKLNESKNLENGLVLHLKALANLIVPLAYSLERQPVKTVSFEARFEQNMGLKIPVRTKSLHHPRNHRRRLTTTRKMR